MHAFVSDGPSRPPHLTSHFNAECQRLLEFCVNVKEEVKRLITSIVFSVLRLLSLQ